MERVLLTIQGTSPSRGAIAYAIRLCKRLKVRLSVLHLVGTGASTRVQRLKQRIAEAKKGFETAMIAVTFAEAGERETAENMVKQIEAIAESLDVDTSQTDLEYHLRVNTDNPSSEIINHVREHRDVVLTICDMGADNKTRNKTGKKARKGSRTARSWARRLEQELPVPLVMVNR